MPYHIISHNNENAPECKIISDNLKEFNLRVWGDANQKDLNLFMRDENDRLVAGLLAFTGFDWLNIKTLWVDETVRGKGLGESILKKAETEAIARGCIYAQLNTFSFQAPGFYRKMGYQMFGELENCPLSKITNHYFYKKLSR